MSGQATMIDPLKMLTMKELLARTGLKRRTVFRLLADDEKARTPGASFPPPVIQRGNERTLRWREVAVIRWMERQERPDEE